MAIQTLRTIESEIRTTRNTNSIDKRFKTPLWFTEITEKHKNSSRRTDTEELALLSESDRFHGDAAALGDRERER